MKIRILFLLAITAMQSIFSVHAEGGCPPGQYPQQGQGWQTCVPIPGSADNQQPQSPPLPQWADHWQAIATDKQKAVLGTSVGNASSDESAQAAISDCRAKGGSDCDVQITYRNGCVAMVIGNTLMNTKGAPTKLEAERLATEKCSGSDTDCHVYYSACDLPVRIR